MSQDLRCPFCGGPIGVRLAWRGSAYLQEQYVEMIECDDYNCGAEWEPDGKLRFSRSAPTQGQ